VLGVEAPEGERQWGEDDIALIEAIGEQLAQTLESARLFADSQRHVERERLVGDITAKLRASTDVRHIIETAAVELGQALGTSRAMVRLQTDLTSQGASSNGSCRDEEGPGAEGQEGTG
jgi:GAF domain-containing protein